MKNKNIIEKSCYYNIYGIQLFSKIYNLNNILYEKIYFNMYMFGNLSYNVIKNIIKNYKNNFNNFDNFEFCNIIKEYEKNGIYNIIYQIGNKLNINDVENLYNYNINYDYNYITKKNNKFLISNYKYIDEINKQLGSIYVNYENFKIYNCEKNKYYFYFVINNEIELGTKKNIYFLKNNIKNKFVLNYLNKI
jgi:hypothetical protein